jgi:hypothetical protein
MENKQDDFIDNVLIKLKRKYRKDEVLSAVIKENSELQIEIGQLKSEIDYLTENHKKELSKLKSDLKNEINIEVQKEFKDSKLRLENVEQKKTIKKLRETISELVSKHSNKPIKELSNGIKV